MTPEQLVERLKAAAPGVVRSVLLYGSAAAGDHAGKRSDYNVLVVAERLGLAELKAISGPSWAWVKAGNPPPMLFTLDGLRRSADTFPIELLDIQTSHRVLFGEDVTGEIQVASADLRLQLERELKTRLIQLREQYLLTRGKPKQVGELLIKSVSSFLVLFRAALRLFQKDVPAVKLEALHALTTYLEFDPAPFVTVAALKAGAKSLREVNAEQLFENYLRTVERVTDAIDAHR